MFRKFLLNTSAIFVVCRAGFDEQVSESHEMHWSIIDNIQTCYTLLNFCQFHAVLLHAKTENLFFLGGRGGVVKIRISVTHKFYLSSATSTSCHCSRRPSRWGQPHASPFFRARRLVVGAVGTASCSRRPGRIARNLSRPGLVLILNSRLSEFHRFFFRLYIKCFQKLEV